MVNTTQPQQQPTAPNTLPEDWVECELLDVCEICDNLRKPINARDRKERIKDKKKSELYPYYGATGQVGYIDDYLTNGVFILIGEDGAPFFDYSKDVAYKIQGKTWVNNHAHILKPKLKNNYLLHFFNHFNYNGFVSGTTRLKLTQGRLKKIPVKFPPLPIQTALVAKIEQLFSSLDRGVAELQHAQTQLKTYRQAVLKKAFEGGLTKEWRKKQTDLPSADELLEQIKEERQRHYEEQVKDWKKAVKLWEKSGKKGKKPTRIRKPKKFSEVEKEELTKNNNIPRSWFWTRLGQVTYKIGDIDHKMPKTVEKGIPYLSTGNIGKNGAIDFKGAKQISQNDFNRLALKIKPEKGDIIFPRYGTIGRNVLIDSNHDFLVSYSCAIIKNIKGIMDSKFVLYYSLSPVIKGEIKKYTVETTQANIGISSIEQFVYPLCSIQEQHQIVRAIETRLSVCDKLEENIAEGLQKARSLRQSILKKAFSGKLLSPKEIAACKQHPDYEPAAVLLEKIKKEKT